MHSSAKTLNLTSERCLPSDASDALLVARVWREGSGPSVVLIENQQVFDITATTATMSGLLNSDDIASTLADAPRDNSLGSIEALLANTESGSGDHFIAPCDLQSIKACGVTFIDSLLERMVEEQAMGDSTKANIIRDSLVECIGADIANIEPGSEEASKIKMMLQEQGMWSQYLEVGLGPDAEVFTKSQPMSAIGLGADLGLHPNSNWNNPEPELVLAVNNHGKIVGASLGNDVNLRDFEGRSALLLGRAKDNNASCVIGPFIRLFDENFTLPQVKAVEVNLRVRGAEGYLLEAHSDMKRISRDIENLVTQVINDSHQYPDGFMLFTGTMYAPIEDRFENNGGFTHNLGDIVEIFSASLGMLVNRVDYSSQVKPWTFGIGSLMQNLASRGYL